MQSVALEYAPQNLQVNHLIRIGLFADFYYIESMAPPLALGRKRSESAS